MADVVSDSDGAADDEDDADAEDGEADEDVADEDVADEDVEGAAEDEGSGNEDIDDEGDDEDDEDPLLGPGFSLSPEVGVAASRDRVDGLLAATESEVTGLGLTGLSDAELPAAGLLLAGVSVVGLFVTDVTGGGELGSAGALLAAVDGGA